MHTSTDFVCLYTYEFWLSLCKIVQSSVILLLPLFLKNSRRQNCDHLNVFLSVIFYVATCNTIGRRFKIISWFYCSEMVLNEVSGHAHKIIFSKFSRCNVKVILSMLLYVTTCNQKVVWDHKLIFCSEVVHKERLMYAKYFVEKVKLVELWLFWKLFIEVIFIISKLYVKL
jgi:hypothetical protein